MRSWAFTGSAAAPTLVVPPRPTGPRVAVVSEHHSAGGAWPGLLPAIALALNYRNAQHLAIRYAEITAGDLTSANFDVVLFPGGYAVGKNTLVRDILLIQGRISDCVFGIRRQHPDLRPEWRRILRSVCGLLLCPSHYHLGW